MNAQHEKLLAQVGQLEQKLAVLTEQTIRDELTHVYNRRFLDQVSTQLKAKARSEIIVTVVDLDRLKKINDCHGHAVGDDAICLAAKLLTACCRKTDYVFRTGGDEFEIIMVNIKAEHVGAAIQRLSARLDKAAQLLSPAGLSYGIASGSPRQIKQLRVTADQRMYEQKQQKSPVLQRVAIYSNNMPIFGAVTTG